MFAGQRQRLIAEEIRRRGGVRVSELTELFSVSDMTIRRDLEALAGAGLIEKVHGGATARSSPSTDEPGFEAKSHRQQNEKDAIAAAAAKLVEAGTAVGLSAGTTTWRLAHHLLEVADLTVVTNSIPVANVLHTTNRSDLTVILTGGVRTPSDALVGPVALASMRSLHLDLLFLGVHGMAEGAGFTTPNLLEAEANRDFIASAARIAVVADHTKWNIRGLCRFARLDDVQVLVTDSGLPRDARTVLAEHIEELVIAPVRQGKRADGTPDNDGRA